MIVGLVRLLFSSCVLVGLTWSHVWSCMLAKSLENGSCIVSVTYLSVRHVHPSHATQLYMMHSATCNIVLFCQDSPTRRTVGVPGMVDQP